MGKQNGLILACGLFQDLIGVNKYVSSTHVIKSSPFLLNDRAAPCFCATRRKPTIAAYAPRSR
ncbi:hypothetical protein XBKB1_870031 [Xenorhabdus bovienii str. kraussei Becker Underwood]|uniref:Uncharacterized protein n=1 Tax=Xenorhabdus bovienii str. kraussei Becker Underwood TaxID=1398204 RepID=A0A077PQY5_XENBV|nr:hypothetical protein XBKB1_870031 [Xenorhabdus bovienii str. kraussei Becker Underwood]